MTNTMTQKTTTYLTPMNRFRFIRSIKSHDDAFWAEKIFNQISFTLEQLEDLQRLHRYATTLHHLDENSCNGWPKETTEIRFEVRDEKGEFVRYCTEIEFKQYEAYPQMRIVPFTVAKKHYRYSVEDLAWRTRDEKKEASITRKIEEIAKAHGWQIELQGDPRGWPMSLKVNGIDCSILVNH